ncbi:MAG: glutaminyl-peptide cyclotransferase [Candidatus Hydrogenedentes bacterium]|nr:glutaminyl-peptide cyclotransferase [Candidatus Hydrogenedentota bacterium]
MLLNCHNNNLPDNYPNTSEPEISEEGEESEGDNTSEGEIVTPWDIEPPFTLTYKIVAKYPHDPNAFTQGLVFKDELLYESTGLWEKSSVRIVDLATGEILLKRNLPEEYADVTFSNLFGEGLAILDSEAYQLTWKNGICFVYDTTDLSLKRYYKYDGEGWGLAYDGHFLIRSDGSNTLYYHYPQNFSISHTLRVSENGVNLRNLNELEFIEGYICANVWQSNYLVVIDPITGNVIGKIILEGLKNQQNNHQADVLNGIAYIPERKTLLVTGKLWDTVFEIALVKPTHNL